ncbi:MAG: CHAT domain-containing protein [Cyclobacteriaceae bacterium]|nr:CHAT domain-containing protein [Cyclobacteriaceae bacterium HetDA_MAG_MS6]
MRANQVTRIICAVVFCVFFTTATAQWEKQFDKAEVKYEVGDYAKALKSIKKTKKKASKKIGAKSAIVAIALVKEAKYNNGFGILTEVQELVKQAVEINEEVNGEGRPEEYAFLLKDAAAVMADYGNFRLGAQYLDRARFVLDSSGLMVEDFAAELDMIKAKVMSGKGFYREAIKLVDDQAGFFQDIIDNSGKKQAINHKREYAEMLIVVANAYRMMGDYLKSDSAFVYNNRWIDNNLGKSDILYAKNQLLNAKLLQENGLAVDAQAKLFQKAYLQATRKYLPSHAIVMEIQKNLMKAYYQNETGSKLRVVQGEFEKTLSKSFPKTSIHTISKDLMDLYFDLADQDIKKIENNINKLMSQSVIPEDHQIKIDLLEFGNHVGLLLGTHKNTESYQKNILRVKENLHGTDAPVYHLTKVKLANYYIDYTDKFAEVSDIYDNSYVKIVRPEITDGHVDYLDILNHLAAYYEATDQYDKANDALKDALLAARKKYDNEDIEYGKELEKIANLQIRIGRYESAQENLEEAKRIFKALKTDEGDASMAIALITEAKLLAIKGEYDEAEDNIFDSDKLREKSEVLTVESTGIDFQDDLAQLYLSIGRLSDADDLLKNSLKEKTRQFGRESRKLNQALVLSGQLSLTKGDYTEAERLARRANTIAISIFGNQSSKTAPSTKLLAKVYSTIGDYDKAEGLLRKTIEIQETQFGRDHIDVGNAISELALVKYYQNAPTKEVQTLFRDAEQIIGKRLGASNPTYAEILKNMAVVSIAAGEYNLAFSYLDDAGRIWNSKIGRRNNINAATINVLKGDIFYRQKNYAKAEDFYKSSQKQYERFFNDTHPEFVKVQSKMSKTHFMQGDWRKSQDEMEVVLDNYKGFIKDYFPSLSEREKAKFWNTIKGDYEFYNTLIVSKNRNEKYLGELFNNALLTKALLLNSSIKIRQRIMNSNDDELKELYSRWIDKKELLTAALSMGPAQLQENGISTTALSSEVELIEKELSLKSEIFSQGIDNRVITWENVKGTLSENEVAIEMVRFRVFDHIFTDSVKYALLYVSGEKKSKPKMILLNNGEELESRYLKYYRNSIKFKLKDTYSYQQFWEPIISKIGTVSKMYLSPDGVYNQINVEAIPTPDGRYVLDNSNIVLVSNTKDLYLNQVTTQTISDQQIAMMFGNPTFYVETSRGIPKPTSGLTRQTANVITDLPGTKKEISELKDYLGRKGWEIDDYTELEADEPSIKKVENPRIFHVATHGFFESKKLQASNIDTELRENYAYENPLLKTGLLLSGAGDILNETRFNYNVDNGILTAYEAMNLNLDQTDLVVLSACETGLGEIEAGEGVYGLQRAFLVAGAKTIVMSLFKVADQATQQLMVKFYRKWIETGDKRQAFIDAKKEIRNEFSDPIYWGPFVMIGLD